MKCEYKFIERYLTGQMDIVTRDAFERHLETCDRCRQGISVWTDMHTALDSYQTQYVDSVLIDDLHNLQHTTQKRYAILHLFPQEFILSVASILLALFIGGLFSSHLVASGSSDDFQHQDIFTQISITSLLAFDD